MFIMRLCKLIVTEHKTGQIVHELQKGYVLKDRLLRPAMVSIAN